MLSTDFGEVRERWERDIWGSSVEGAWSIEGVDAVLELVCHQIVKLKRARSRYNGWRVTLLCAFSSLQDDSAKPASHAASVSVIDSILVVWYEATWGLVG
jgi:hypothetical protein